jgi:hypothetical protein
VALPGARPVARGLAGQDALEVFRPPGD